MRLTNGLIFIITYLELTGQTNIRWYWILVLIILKIAELIYRVYLHDIEGIFKKP